MTHRYLLWRSNVQALTNPKHDAAQEGGFSKPPFAFSSIPHPTSNTNSKQPTVEARHLIR